ncbi:hypothetical protein, partial [Lactobacillus gigeriorum]|uniref:hypothetical protein n=1 Tax=Lactobacillus gigeriorum TaxID=1203069 RepID=UPI0019D71919
FVKNFFHLASPCDFRRPTTFKYITRFLLLLQVLFLLFLEENFVSTFKLFGSKADLNNLQYFDVNSKHYFDFIFRKRFLK